MNFPWLSRTLSPNATAAEHARNSEAHAPKRGPHHRLAEALRAQARAARGQVPPQLAPHIIRAVTETVPADSTAADQVERTGRVRSLPRIMDWGILRLRWFVPALGVTALAVAIFRPWTPPAPNGHRLETMDTSSLSGWREKAARWEGAGLWADGATLAQGPLEQEARHAAEDSRQLLLAMAQDVVSEPTASRVISGLNRGWARMAADREEQ